MITGKVLYYKRTLNKGTKVEVIPRDCSIVDVKAFQLDNDKAEYFTEQSMLVKIQTDSSVYESKALENECLVVIDIEYDDGQVNKPNCTVNIL